VNVQENVLNDLLLLSVMTVLNRLVFTNQVTKVMIEWDLTTNGADRNRLLHEGG
jgi:hypothetical protein